MSDSTTNLDTISQSQSQKEVSANALFDACSPASLFGRRASTCAGLVWGYYGGRFNGTTLANGTVTATASNTNYIVIARATNVVSIATTTTNWNDTANYGRAFKLTAGASSITAYEDWRASNDGTGVLSQQSYLNIPQNSKSAAYTTVLADAGKHLLHPTADANARTFTINSNANVAYPIGTAISFVNQTSQVLSIAITSDTLTLAGSIATGTRSLAQNGIATALKIELTNWLISGTGLT